MKRQLSLVLALVMILGSFSSVFAAVSVDQSAVNVAGKFLKAEGVLEGDDGNLMLNANLKRRDAVVLVSRLLGEEEAAKVFPSGDLTFKDLTDDYYNGFIAWSVAKEIIEGHNAETFGFNEEMTAQQFATVLLRVLGHEVNDEAYPKALELAEELGLLIDIEDLENGTVVTRGMMALMAFNALYVKVKGTDKTLAETLGIENLPEREEEKATELKVEEVYTENLAEIRVKLSNAELVKTEDALYNPGNYRLGNVGDDEVAVRHVHLEGDEVVLTLVPYGKTEEQPDFDVLRKGKLFHLTIRNIHRDINKSYNNNEAKDNEIPTIKNVDFMGDYGIKVTTSEPIAYPLERDFRTDSRTAMIVEQYGKDIILTPYHGKAFDKDATELTIDLLNDFAGYKTVKTVEKMALSTDEGLPKVERAYRSGHKLVVEFDRDVYHKSVEAYESRRELGNVSFVEKRAPFYAVEAVKVDTNVVEYTFEREIPKGMEITVEGVANHFNKTMEKDVRVPEEYKDDFAPVVISTNHNVSLSKTEDDKISAGLTGTDKEIEEKVKKRLDDGFEATTGKTTVTFDKDIAQFVEHMKFVEDSSKGREIDVKDFFTLYELDITKRGETAAKDVVIKDVKVLKDRIELSYEKIKVNNKDRDYDYILEVRNLSDLSGNRMDREYLDFQVLRYSNAFDVKIKDIRTKRYFNRDGVEIVLEFNDYVNKEEAAIAKNYYLDSNLDVDEAIVERDGKTVSLVVYDQKTVASFLNKYKVLEVSPRVEALAWPYPSVANRFWDLATQKAIEDTNKADARRDYINEDIKDYEGFVTKVAIAGKNLDLISSAEDDVLVSVTSTSNYSIWVDQSVANTSENWTKVTGNELKLDSPFVSALKASIDIDNVEQNVQIRDKDNKVVETVTLYTKNLAAANLVSATLTGRDAAPATPEVPAGPDTPAVAATGTIKFGTPADGDTVTVDGTEFEFQTDDSADFKDIDELTAKINALPNVSASKDGTEITITATTAGAAGDSIALATSKATEFVLSGATLSGGVDLIPGTPAVPEVPAVARIAPELTLTFNTADVKVGTYTVDMVIGGTLYKNLTAKVTSAAVATVTDFADTVNYSDLTGKPVTGLVGIGTVNGEDVVITGTVTLN